MSIHAGDLFSDPVSPQPANTRYAQVPSRDDNAQAKPADLPTEHLTIEQVGQLLDMTYPGKNTVTNNGQTYYTLNVQKDTWTFHLVVSLSPNGNVLWIDAPLVKITDPASVSPTAAVDLLKKNSDLGPIFFQINSNQMLELTEPTPNRDLNLKNFGATMEGFMTAVRSTESTWKKDVILPAAAGHDAPATPATDPKAAPAKNPLTRNPLAR